MCQTMYQILLLMLYDIPFSSFGQKIGYNQTCNSTEECSDHRYSCREDHENVFRCLCDRFHSWMESVGCVQLYNATEIMNMSLITVSDNLKSLEDQVRVIMKTQIAAGLFVFAMVIVAAVTTAAFCIYVHVKDHSRKAPILIKNNVQPSVSSV